ncbi:hypothetical protein [Neoroseomonas lacus]|uniref:Uncharacterized protein n=1 Tax=Neoroseomonas lacus TaxID=287609 RepID=A0A917KRP6_9PROT|nr:hypothetical protein [Neoroseomonas lacus]GGJ23299.1 hypothetical protein GCM10011320_33280 [Neoroseomonas lacus]
MDRIEPPRPADQAARIATRREAAPEPSTNRALWPTFMRRTLEEEQVRASAQKERRPDRVAV